MTRLFSFCIPNVADEPKLHERDLRRQRTNQHEAGIKMGETGKPKQQSAWSFTRQCYLDAKGDPALAEKLVRERATMRFRSIWVTIIVAIAIQLIKLWWENRVTDPGEKPSSDFDEMFSKSENTNNEAR
jgi:hypothetical protein